MRAIILAAGLGTRLRPLTDNIPKCLVTIKNKPLLEIWLEKLKTINIDDILINTCYLAEKVEKYINESEFKNCVTLMKEEKLLGTAGTLIKNIDFFQNMDGILIHADNFTLDDLTLFKIAHNNRPKHCLFTMLIFQTNNAKDCGVVELDDEGIVVGFHEKIENPKTNLANGAVYILSPEFYSEIIERFENAKDFSNDIIKNFVGRIFTYETKKLFIDIGTIENYSKVNK